MKDKLLSTKSNHQRSEVSESNAFQQRPSHIKIYTILTTIGWILCCIISLLWNTYHIKNDTLEIACIQARVVHEKDVIYRRWNSNNGGVYVPVSEKTKPNPYLSDISERDIITPSGRLLTLINPAYMTRKVHELHKEVSDIRGHITSLNPIRPENTPDEWEKKALKKFETGLSEVNSIEYIEGKEYLRLIRPLLTEKGCLKCHAKQGYKENDIRGGISVAIPMQPLWNISNASIARIKFIHFLILCIGLGGLIFGYIRISKSEQKRNEAEIELQRAFSDIEKQVAERTIELKKEIEMRENAQKSLLVLAQQWQTTMDAMNDAICILDTNHQIIKSNRLMQDLFAKKGIDIFDKHCWEVVHGTKTPLPECPVLKMKETLKREYLETCIGERWYEIAVDPLFNANNQLVGAVHIIRDQTFRKQAEDKIKAQLDELQRWYNVMNKREDRILELKKEVNELLSQLGKPMKYRS